MTSKVSEGKNKSLIKNGKTALNHTAYESDFSISSDYLSKLNTSFRYSIKISVILIAIGVLLIILGQSFRFDNAFDYFFIFLAIFGLLLVIFGFLTLIRDLQLSNLAKIQYNMKIEPRGIAIFQNNISLTEPISFFPFNAIISSEIVSVSKFLKKRGFPSASSTKFIELSSEINGVLLKFKVDFHDMEINQQQIFFDLPLGYSLFIVDDVDNFLKMIKSKQIK